MNAATKTAAMILEVEIRSATARNDIYELRNFLQAEEGIQLHIKEQPPQQGEMTLGLIEPVIVGIVEGVVGHSIGDIYNKMLKPKIANWMKSKQGGDGLEVLSTIKEDDGTRIHFLEDGKGRSEVFENLKYAIDVDRTRVVLVGNSEFDGSFSSIPPVKGNIEDLHYLLTDKLHIGIPQENIVVAFNKTNTEIEEILLQQSRQPGTETLIIYFAGHGHRTDVKKLYLVAKNSKRIDDYLIGGIDFDFISNVVLRNATAKQKILILDACHSGIATQGTNDMMQKIDVKGSYVLASSPGDEVSYFEKNGRNTYFTGVLLNVLRSGVDNASEMIALEDLYDYSKEQLSDKNFPHPIYKNELNIPPSNFFIARNPSFSLEKLRQRPERLYRQGRFEEALYEYRLLLQRYPEDMELRAKTSECETNALFNRLVQDGDEMFFHAKDYGAAIEKYRKALQIKDDMLVVSKMSKCQDYMHAVPREEKKETQKMSTVVEEKKENIFIPVKVKDELKKENTTKAKKEETRKMEISVNEKTFGIVLSALWLVAAVYFIFSNTHLEGTDVFFKVILPVAIVGGFFVAIRLKKIASTELLLYAHGFFICILPLIGQYIDSREHSGKAMLLFAAYNAGYVFLILKKIKEFVLADIIIASVSIAYLSFFFFYALFFITFRPAYGENTGANAIGMLIGLSMGVLGIVKLTRMWAEEKRKKI